MKLTLPVFDRDETRVHVVGAGGTGSAIMAGLCKLATLAKALGLPPIVVTLWDDDTVSPSNVGRQAFTKADVGLNKARVLINRCNLTYGLGWKARAEKFCGIRDYQFHVVIGCVDTRSGRATMQNHFDRASNALWIDCGNRQSSGQVVMGCRADYRRVLPSVADLFPEVVDVEADADDNTPTCSVAESIARQDPMVNQLVADQAAGLLWRFMRFGELEASGAFVDVQSFSVLPMPIDPEYWASLGWQADPPMRHAA